MHCCRSFGRKLRRGLRGLAGVFGINCNAGICDDWCKCSFKATFEANKAAYTVSVERLKDAISKAALDSAYSTYIEDPEKMNAWKDELVSSMMGEIGYNGRTISSLVLKVDDTKIESTVSEPLTNSDLIQAKIDYYYDLVDGSPSENRTDYLREIVRLEHAQEIISKRANVDNDRLAVYSAYASVSNNMTLINGYVLAAKLIIDTFLNKKQIIQDIASGTRFDLETVEVLFGAQQANLVSLASSIEQGIIDLEYSIGLLPNVSDTNIKYLVDDIYYYIDEWSKDLDYLNSRIAHLVDITNMDTEHSELNWIKWGITR